MTSAATHDDARPRPRLGEMLVQRGWITGEQLIRAIQSQRAQGGRIGTCLLELDALSEDRLLEALAQQLGAPSVDVDQLESIDDDVLSLVPQDLAARCRAVPVDADADEIRVAALNADDLSLLKLLAPNTERRVRPMVANEVRILDALRRHYGIEVPHRYQPLIDRLNDQRARRHDLDSDAFVVDWRGPDAALSGEHPAMAPATSTAPAPNAPPPSATTTSAPATSPSATPPTIASLARTLADQHDTQAIGQTLVSFFTTRFPRSALLKVHGRKAHGWLASAEGLDTEAFDALEIDLDEASVFAEMADGFPLHRGPIDPVTPHQALVRCWGSHELVPCIVVPIWVRDRLIGMLYGDRGASGLGEVDLDEIEAVGVKAGLAFELCILRRKLLREHRPNA